MPTKRRAASSRTRDTRCSQALLEPRLSTQLRERFLYLTQQEQPSRLEAAVVNLVIRGPPEASSGATWEGVQADVRACDGRNTGEDYSVMTLGHVQSLLAGRVVDLPTCPACAVLLDEALERRRA